MSGGQAVRVTFTAEQRERLIRAAISTQSLSGFTLPREIAETAFDTAMQKPLPQIGQEDTP